MKKILKAYRDYNMKNWRKIFLLAGLPVLAVITVLFVLNLTGVPPFGGTVWNWLFIALYVVYAVVVIKTLYTAVKSRPARLERHLYAISEKERNTVFEEFDLSKSENGRFFLSEFLLLFTDCGGIIRYAKIGEVSVIGKAIWLASGKKAVMLKAKTNEEALEVAKKIQERIPEDTVIEDEEEELTEEQIKAQETDEKIMKDIVGIKTDEETDSGDNGE